MVFGKVIAPCPNEPSSFASILKDFSPTFTLSSAISPAIDHPPHVQPVKLSVNISFRTTAPSGNPSSVVIVNILCSETSSCEYTNVVVIPNNIDKTRILAYNFDTNNPSFAIIHKSYLIDFVDSMFSLQFQ